MIALSPVPDQPEPEVSVVIPCLNEAETIGICLEKAGMALAAGGITGEVIVADNGSSDGSQEIARAHGARLIHVQEKGYGRALMAGIGIARGRYIVMGDSDDSYDFTEIPRFVTKLREGFDLVQGCRLPGGGGRVLPGAMPFLHRWLGNPLFSYLSRWWFGAPINDIYCGMRGFTRALYDRLDQRCTGMEFATEMIIKSCLHGASLAEVPITLYPDGRTKRGPHLRTFSDGWRTLRFFLMFSPRWLFLIPGIFLVVMGIAGYSVAMPGLELFNLRFDAHTLLFASLFIICGYQAILFAIFTKTFAVNEGLLPEDKRLARFFEIVYLERGLMVGGTALLAGVLLLLGAIELWRLSDFGALDYPKTMRWVIPGSTLTVLGFQTVLSSFFVSIIGMKRR